MKILSFIISIVIITILVFVAMRIEKANKLSPKTNYQYLGDGIGTVEANGITLAVNTKDRSIGHTIIKTGDWEPHISDVMKSLVKPGDNIIDLGANYGVHSIKLAKHLHGDCKVYSFEANPETFKLLNKNILVNGYGHIISSYNMLVADTDGKEFTFTYNDNKNVGGAKITHTTDPNYIHNFDKFMKLKSVKLDTIIPEDVKIDFIKIDIEGAEFMALEGAKRVLSSSDDLAIVMEWNKPLLEMNEPDPISKLKQLIDQYNFHLYIIKYSGGFKPITLDALEEVDAGDIILSKKKL